MEAAKKRASTKRREVITPENYGELPAAMWQAASDAAQSKGWSQTAKLIAIIVAWRLPFLVVGIAWVLIMLVRLCFGLSATRI